MSYTKRITIMTQWFCAGLALLLTGCAGLPFDLSQTTVGDLTSALARATAARDLPAMQCYPVLIEIVSSAPNVTDQTSIAGVVDAFEAARLASKKVQAFSGATDPRVQTINLACAALFNDVQGDMLRLGVKFRP